MTTQCAELAENEDKVESLQTSNLDLREKLRSVEAEHSGLNEQMEAQQAELDDIKVGH